MLRDLAERYAKLGVVTSAAEIFEEIELWDEVVQCYRIAGNERRALATVRARLAERETPRMCAALGSLTNDPKYFERALELSNGKFYDAHVALGKLHFDRGDMRKSFSHYRAGLAIKPLMPAVWFRVGTICMQLKEWDAALRAFTEVVQQEPEEGDAWANVAAIHMHRKNPSEAYPALVEVSHTIIACLHPKGARCANISPSAQSLKQNRNNWRVWVSKLYTCIDLKKWDEAIQTCTELLNLKARINSSADIPTPEEKVIRAILGGSLQNFRDARASDEKIALDSSRRTLTRARQLLDKLKSSTKSEVWLYEVSARFNEEMGLTENVYEDLMKEYRTLQTVKGWEDDPVSIYKMTSLVEEIYAFHKATGIKEGLVKCKLLINGIAKKIRCANCDSKPPKEIAVLNALLSDLDNSMGILN
jgi:tetratricopeptide (TPR) repeat protein